MKFNKKIFSDELKEFYGKTLRKQPSTDNLESAEVLLFLSELDEDWHSLEELAYFFATIGWETAWTFEPIVERKASANQSDVRRLQERYWKTGYYGRGYVQLTWKENYHKLGKAIGVDLVNKPDELLKPTVSYEVAATGMRDGMFRSRPNGTPVKLADYINGDKKDFVNARNIINGDTDKNGPAIARFAEKLLEVLSVAVITTPNDITAGSVEESNSAQWSPVMPQTQDSVYRPEAVITSATGNDPWNPPVKLPPTVPVPTNGPTAIITTIVSTVSGVGISGSAVYGYISGALPSINPNIVLIACLACIVIVSCTYIVARLYIKNARENRAAMLDVQKVAITSDPTKTNVEIKN